MRGLLVELHRYVGLAMAAFLAIAGLTGSALAFRSELDAALNPNLFHVERTGAALPLAELARRVEIATPGVQVRSIMPPASAHGTSQMFVEPRGGAHRAVDNLFVDPATGTVLGARLWGAARLDAPHLIPFLYRFHYSLHIPGNWGPWLMGGVALAWMFDCLVGFYLTLPRGRASWRKWRASWAIKRGAGPYRINLDLHRATGLWLWPVLFLLALTSVAFNLNAEVFRPVLTAVLPTSPVIWDRNPPADRQTARIDWDEAARIAAGEAVRRGWPDLEMERILLARTQGFYQVKLGPRHPAGFGNIAVYIDSTSGQVVSVDRPGAGPSGDVVNALVYPVHSGQVAGLPGRILICLTGLAVTILSVTGCIIWWKKRRARVVRQRRQELIPYRTIGLTDAAE